MRLEITIATLVGLFLAGTGYIGGGFIGLFADVLLYAIGLVVGWNASVWWFNRRRKSVH